MGATILFIYLFIYFFQKDSTPISKLFDLKRPKCAAALADQIITTGSQDRRVIIRRWPTTTAAAQQTERINTIATLSKDRESTTAVILGSNYSGNSISSAGSIRQQQQQQHRRFICPNAKVVINSRITNKKDWCLLSVSFEFPVLLLFFYFFK